MERKTAEIAACYLTNSHANSLTHTLAHSHTHSHANSYSLTHTLTHASSHTHMLTHTLAHSFTPSHASPLTHTLNPVPSLPATLTLSKSLAPSYCSISFNIVYKSPSDVPILKCLNPHSTPPSSLIKTHFNIINWPTLISSKWSLSASTNFSSICVLHALESHFH